MKKFLLTALLFAVATLRATIITVPSDYPSIQQAIDAAQATDTVLVEPGVYYENLHLRGRDIFLTSRFMYAADTSFIRTTVINGSQPAFPDSASCIIINGGESSDCVIQGFTITGGGGTRWLDEHGAGYFREGGGILIQASAPVIQFNYIRGNWIVNTASVSSTGGGAIRCGDGDPQIVNNVICDNQGRYGCGIVFNYSTGLIANNLIVYNSGGQNYGGGGIWCTGTDSNTVVKIYNNTIAHNHVTGSSTFGGKGGGVLAMGVRLELANNIIWDNTQSSGSPVRAFLSAVISANYNDISGGYAGTGNVNVNPAFTDTMCFYLAQLSPCIDAGDSAIDDITLNMVNPLPPAQGLLRSDMGCYGGPRAAFFPCCNMPPVTGTNDLIAEETISVYPVPATDQITIDLSDLRGIFSLRVMDASGRLICDTKISGKWQSDLSSWNAGQYYYAITGSEGKIQHGTFSVVH